MINLKLAEYKDGKFERFLELGSNYGNFFYCGDCIGIWDESPEIKNGNHYFKDAKDPLNRFNGLFDGRTYGEGRFVLIESKIIDRFGKKITMTQDDIFRYNEFYQKACDFVNFHHWQETEDELETNPDFRILGNLHENPELFLKKIS